MNSERPRIAIVEDDSEIRTMVVDLLTRENWDCTGVPDGSAFDSLVANAMPDVAILDINLPGEDGLSIARRLAALRSPPAIIMLTARGEEIDRIIGLEIGADDYLGKPFNPRELVARVRALLRRIRLARNEPAAVLRVAGLSIDRAQRSVTGDDGTEIALSGAEYELLVALAEASGRVLSRDFLLDRIHGREAMPFDRAIDVLASRLRKKVDRPGEVTIIEGVRNLGYVLRDRCP
ncbi:response regulator transcription factor [Parerythrobacter aurantius]|uniref:response regulator transcription factor n=1 Tax=Parerythrobacter aurantius TaxID=3127706 RepID=UPI0032446BD4